MRSLPFDVKRNAQRLFSRGCLTPRPHQQSGCQIRTPRAAARQAPGRDGIQHDLFPWDPDHGAGICRRQRQRQQCLASLDGGGGVTRQTVSQKASHRRDVTCLPLRGVIVLPAPLFLAFRGRGRDFLREAVALCRRCGLGDVPQPPEEEETPHPGVPNSPEKQ